MNDCRFLIMQTCFSAAKAKTSGPLFLNGKKNTFPPPPPKAVKLSILSFTSVWSKVFP